MTPHNKTTCTIKPSPNIRSQICSKNRWNKLLFLLSSSYRIISLNGVHHYIQIAQNKCRSILPILFPAASGMEQYLSKLQAKPVN
jgi:hypothetical protein